MTRIIACVVLGASLLGSGLAAAQPADGPAKQALQRAMAYVGGLDSATVQISEKVRLSGPGQTQEASCKMAVSLKGKDKLFADGQRDDVPFTIVSDGKSRFFVNKKEKAYTTPSSMTTRAKLLTEGLSPIAAMGLSIAAKFLHNDPAWLTDAECTENGEEKLTSAGPNDPPAKKIAVKTKGYTADLWIGSGDTPLLRQYRIDATASLGGAAQGISLVFEGQLDAWQPNVALDDTLFAFAPPPGFQKLAMEGQPAYLDQPAPAAVLDLLGGGKLDLAEYKDKNVVVFDFWATWCPPCRRTLPAVDQIAKDYAGKGVKVFAINSGEEPERVKEFATKMGLTLPIALDKDGKVNTAYGAGNIPFMVIIDKQGVVRSFHVGASPTIKDDIASELDVLLAAPAPAQPK